MSFRSRTWKHGAFALAAMSAVALASAPASAQGKPDLSGKFQDWYVYTSGKGADRVCYALGQPRDSQPTNVRRDPIFFLISTWPAKNSRNEPSVVPGYPYREGSKVHVEIGGDKFEFFTENHGTDGGAWMQNPANERRLVNAMKRGATMIVTGTSTRGTLTRDTYSLSGITAALDNIAKTCK